MGRLGRKERRFLAEILYGFIRRDYLRVAEVHFEAGYVPHAYRVEDFAQALRAIGEPIHSRTADQISMAKLLTLLFEITSLFEMTTRVELVMLQKTMVVVEAWRESSTLSSTCGRPPNRWSAPGSRTTWARSGASRTPAGFVLYRRLPCRRPAAALSKSRPTRDRRRKRNCESRSGTQAPAGTCLCFDWIFAGASVHRRLPVGLLARAKCAARSFVGTPSHLEARAAPAPDNRSTPSLQSRAANTTIVLIVLSLRLVSFLRCRRWR